MELGVQIVSMSGTKSHKLIQIGEERKSLKASWQAGFGDLDEFSGTVCNGLGNRCSILLSYRRTLGNACSV